MKRDPVPNELYRVGGGNVGMFRPRDVDRESGLSFWDNLEAMINDRAGTPYALEAGDGYVVINTNRLRTLFTFEPDATKLGHWLAKPTDPSKIDEWIEHGSSHALTRALKEAIIRPVRQIR